MPTDHSDAESRHLNADDLLGESRRQELVALTLQLQHHSIHLLRQSLEPQLDWLCPGERRNLRWSSLSLVVVVVGGGAQVLVVGCRLCSSGSLCSLAGQQGGLARSSSSIVVWCAIWRNLCDCWRPFTLNYRPIDIVLDGPRKSCASLEGSKWKYMKRIERG